MLYHISCTEQWAVSFNLINILRSITTYVLIYLESFKQKCLLTYKNSKYYYIIYFYLKINYYIINIS